MSRAMDPRPANRVWTILPLLVAVLAGVWLASNGRLTSDEPSYLYAGTFLEVAQIVSGDVQPSGIPGFLQGRILHLLFIKGVMSVTGAGETGFHILLAIHLVLVCVNVWLIGLILRALLPKVIGWRAAAMLVAMSPIILYMAFKTLADTESLAAALVAIYSLIRVAQRNGRSWLALTVIGLATAALIKNQMVFVPAAGWAALCLVPIAGIERRRLAILGAASGIAAMLMTLIFLKVLGVSLDAYLESYRYPFANVTPLIAKFMNLGTELGLLWLLLPVAVFSHRRRELAAFGLWLVLSMSPFLFLSGVEPRQVAVNLAAAAGLFALALEVISDKFDAWRRMSDSGRSAFAVVGVLILMASNAFMLAIMPHKVDLDELRALLKSLDGRYGTGRYVLLSSNGYTDFHIIRVLWPERDVRHAGTAVMSVVPGPQSREERLRAYLGDRYVDSMAGIETVDRPLVFFGFPNTFAAENLKTMLDRLSPGLRARVMAQVNLTDHLYRPETSWLWGNPNVRLEPVATVGHYRALEVVIVPHDDGVRDSRGLTE